MGTTDSETGIWRASVKIHSYDVDFRKRATIAAICRAFLEAAWNHAEHLGVGYGELAKQNRLWVLARIFVQLERYPRWGETLELTTWPRAASGVFALRDFEIFNVEGTRAAAGSSSWLVLDADTHRPQRIEKLLSRIPTPVTRKAVGRESKRLPSTEPGAAALTTIVAYSDIDVNQHATSARYIGWILDSYPADFHRTHVLRGVEMNYVGETLWGDTITVFVHQRSSKEFSHLIVKSDRSEVCRAELEWIAEPT
jgi:medium-chain acyl-[acyl-carrier-protein] hydrolase